MACALIWIGCAGVVRVEPRPFTGKLPDRTKVDLAGAFTLSPNGELGLALVKPCAFDPVAKQGVPTSELDATPCDRPHLDAVQVIATTPWQREIRGAWLDPKHLVFRADWKVTGLDPLAADTPGVLAKPWLISGTSWTPSPTEASQLLDTLGRATDTEPALVHGGAAPRLEVTAFEAADGTLRAGTGGTLIVKIANHGPGAAYRVTATTRSSVASLHDQRLSFGMIQPGAEKTRQLSVAIPDSETSPDTMLVLVVAEGNGFAPQNVSHRVPIAASANAPAPVAPSAPGLAIHCTVPGHDAARLELSAGDGVSLHCIVDNSTKKPTRVELETTIAGHPPVKSRAQAVAAGGNAAFDVPLVLPRDLAIDAPVEIALDAHDRKAKLDAHTALTAVVHERRLCTPGQLTRAQYQAKLTELRALVKAGDMTQAQLDRYDAELVACLN
ncbi:MAG TPA: hypothetical protein VH165_09290 [Kofleriaceae bacterium]|nr:hypothetical protein [Kofleriaceae bacterium]